MEKEIDHEYTSNIVCPYCGHEYQDSWETEEDYGTQECGECDKKFSYSRNVTVEYTTTKLCDNNGVQHVWGKPNRPHFFEYQKKWIAGRHCVICGETQLVKVDQDTHEVVRINGNVVLED